MTLEQVNKAMVNGRLVKHTYNGSTILYKIGGVFTEYSEVKGWKYSLVLRDRGNGCVVVARMEDCEVADEV